MSNRLNRYHALFHEVPLWGGQEWKSLDIDSLVAVHTDATDAIIELSEAEKKSAIEEFESRNGFVRWFKKVRGWQTPSVPTRQEIANQMIDRLRSLADWMEGNQNRRFYQDSDMSAYIVKPRAVADRLERLFVE